MEKGKNMAMLIRTLTLVAVLFSSGLFKNGIHAGEATLKAGVEAMNRGHYATALRAFRNLAKEGDAQAENNIGYLYERGLGVPQDYSKALKWYKLSADKSLPEAQYNTGLLYHYGYGVAKNQSEARKWFERAAKKGYTEAEYMMGQFFQNGWGVRTDGLKALAWYKRAAKKGKIEAQFMTGVMFLSGDAGKEEAVKGYAWAHVSMQNGYEGAKEVLDYAELSMKDNQVKMAKALSKRCIVSKLRQCP